MDEYFIIKDNCIYRITTMSTLPDFPDTTRKELILTKETEGSDEDGKKQ